MCRIKIVDKPEEGIVEIEGVPYSYTCFQDFAGKSAPILELGAPFMLIRREEGEALHVRRLGDLVEELKELKDAPMISVKKIMDFVKKWADEFSKDVEINPDPDLESHSEKGQDPNG